MAKSSAATEVSSYTVDNCTCINQDTYTDLYYMELVSGTDATITLPTSKTDPIEVKLKNFN